MKKETQTHQFEESLKELESIVEKLEAGDVALEKSLELYEKGIHLYRFCSGKLDEAKKKVEVLTKKGGQLVPEPLAGADSSEESEEEVPL